MEPTSERIDSRYSDPAADAVPWKQAVARLAAAEVAWIVTVRPDGRPHSTPMTPVVRDDKVYFHTGAPEVKHTNLESNPHVLVLAGDTAWECGLDVVVEGVAAPVTDEAVLREVVELYASRWDGRWKLRVLEGRLDDFRDREFPLVPFEVTPTKAFAHSKGDPFSQTNYRF
ncbi:pyridoxamine 5'-phosphate oxidase family protein [Gryllotalpicola daejeonensis]|uniref:Pyridoxamine 5'-phosphate oxidase family protein n=1 Tax=Gryllotalpicola daejeonensis TaxID=993087 RepID=A0ABP7ZME0_9MICO